MARLISIKLNNGETCKVLPRWRGKNLAVHAPVVDRVCERQPQQWIITHLATGFKTGGEFYGPLKEAILSARLWDDMFSTATAENANRWPMRKQWLRILRQGRAERPWRSIETVKEILAGV